MEHITGQLTTPQRLTGTLSAAQTLKATLSRPEIVQTLPYTGEYVFTAGDEAQEIPTEGYRMLHNIVINPVPSNYGLITWNGSTLTVS